MSTLQVANVWFESTANTRIQYMGSNTIAVVSAGSNALTVNSTVAYVSTNGSITVPVGTTAQRPTGANGMIRFNTTTGRYEFYDTTNWYTFTGPRGGSTDDIFWENSTTVTTDYTITTGKNAFTAGPVTINSSINVTIPSGSTWTIS